MLRQLAHLARLFGYSLQRLGPASMLRASIGWFRDAEARRVDSGFDLRFGTDTNNDLTPGEAKLPRERRSTATMYLPTMDCDLHQLLAALPWAEAQRRASTFIDLGSGKGRAVFLAAMAGFREVIGVELSPVLHATAELNLARLEEDGALRSPVTLLQQDAATVELPPGPVIIYLYHPFQTEVLREVMANLQRELHQAPRPAAILYCHPTLQRPIPASVFEETGCFQLEREGARRTQHFQVGWTVFSNEGWLTATAAAPVPETVSAAVGGMR